MILDVGNFDLLTTINTTLLKKTMDTNEALIGEILKDMNNNTQDASDKSSNLNVLDIYA